MPSFSVIVKAPDAYQAKVEVAARGLTLTDARYIGSTNVVGYIHTDWSTVQRWFAEDLGQIAPFRTGACLGFTEDSPSVSERVLCSIEPRFSDA